MFGCWMVWHSANKPKKYSLWPEIGLINLLRYLKIEHLGVDKRTAGEEAFVYKDK